MNNTRSSTKRRTIVWTATGAIALLAAGGVCYGGAQYLEQHNAEITAASAELKQATQALEAEADRVAASASDVVLPKLADAEQKLAESQGRTLDEEARMTLQDAITAARAAVDEVEKDAGAVVDVAKAIEVDDSFFEHADNLRAAAKKVEAETLPDPGTLSSVVAALDTPKQQVDAAVAAWEKQRERDNAYVEHVRTAGWQDAIDACSDSVDITEWYGTATVAEHWSCGGASFPRETGTLVHFTGQFEGFYRVVGIPAYLNVHTDSISDVPRGYDLLFQTCIDGDSSNMAMVALEREG
ncbi:hypothetical protein ACFVAJ_18720 [Agromyces sp. NPDC057679]|uniref:hypothetical protein n=1 Tax=Agromyces sp. NPDC057679 TaxID=3346207 RepID=UPI00366E9044